MERLADWHCKPAGYKRAFVPAENDPRMRESDIPIECFEFGDGEAETERRVWINEFSSRQDILNVPKIVNSLLNSTPIKEAEKLD